MSWKKYDKMIKQCEKFIRKFEGEKSMANKQSENSAVVGFFESAKLVIFFKFKQLE